MEQFEQEFGNSEEAIMQDIDNNDELMNSEESMNSSEFSSDSELDDFAINPTDIELQVKCEVGRLSISLERLLNLKTGDVLEIDTWPQMVKLVCNGNYIAQGYLVEVNGMLGVKIAKKISYH